MTDVSKMRRDTRVVHAGQHGDPVTGAVSVPIVQSSTFRFVNADEGADRFAGRDPGHIYTRIANPTIQALEEALMILENGCGAMAAATGMAAVNTVYFSLLSQGDHIVATEAMYGPSRTVLETQYTRFGIEATFVDSADTEAVRAAMRPNTKLVYLETPANPTLKLTDLEACIKIAHDGGALVCVDNTFATPLNQRPLDMGCDVVLHSMTKYINGHTDVVAGMVVVKEEALYKRMLGVHRNLGGTMDPHQAWLVHRGLRTLALRVDKAEANAMIIGEYLENHPKVAWIRFPGLKSHPQYDLAQRQMDGPGAVMSFGVKGGLEAGKTVIDNVQIMTLAVSLGGIETLIEHPASMTHAGISAEEKATAGISDDLVRLAVGCEDPEDLKDDLARVLDMI
jgi:methionine-gamma-lyase